VTDADCSIVDAFLHERGRLRRFIRRRVPAAADAEDILQEVFFELVEAARLLKPVEHVGAWLFRVARNRIIDLFRKNKTDRNGSPGAMPTTETVGADEFSIEDLLPSAQVGREAVWRYG